MCVQEIGDLFSGAGQGAAEAASGYGTGAAADYLMGTPVTDLVGVPGAGDAASALASSYSGMGNINGMPYGGDIMGPPQATGIPISSTLSLPSYSGGSTNQAQPTSGGGGSTLSSIMSTAKPFIAPALGLGAALYGANAQNQMAQNLNQGQQASYNQYLNALNPPEDVKQAQYQKAVNQILPTASLNQRKIYNELASRGVRGAGLASPTAGMQRDVTKAKQNAYLDIYGRYNVPQALPPVSFTPGTSNLIGSSVGDIGTAMLLKNLFG